MSLTPEQVSGVLGCVVPGSTVYLIGAGGCGMSGVGHMLLDLGFDVAGSDLICNRDVGALVERGARIFLGHDAERLLRENPVLVVFSSAVTEGHPELDAARNAGIPVARRAALPAALITRRMGVCVAGMHGKTTTSAMLAWTLDCLGTRPSYAVGASMLQLAPNARFTGGMADACMSDGWFVVETDESDGTLEMFKPRCSVLLNIDEEHLDHYRDMLGVVRAFEGFISSTSDRIVYCSDDPVLRRLCAGLDKAVSYGFCEDADYRIGAMEFVRAGGIDDDYTAFTRFSMWRHGELLGEFELQLLGEKNVSNAAAVVALLHQYGFAPESIARALRVFKGTVRRQHEIFRDTDLRIIDDYAHHPMEIKPTLKALKQITPGRLLVAFQPHRYSRTKHLVSKFASCFEDADVLWLTDIYSANEPAIPGVSGMMIANAVRASGMKAEYVPAVSMLNGLISGVMRAGDTVVFLGAGDITDAAHDLADTLKSMAIC
ncbi:MAG: UDP-N-acetylmuramate--L-alanine ligase [Verrucomicrobia bacterium]|nr:UDP-N-acetylmuramate--L-alanine ligase [Verrucomicrobiota bacterium]MCF7708874.1 UDP-N-acetylmuramate--L-alanine ligase [Verrucomicrobiota bacterium]